MKFPKWHTTSLYWELTGLSAFLAAFTACCGEFGEGLLGYIFYGEQGFDTLQEGLVWLAIILFMAIAGGIMLSRFFLAPISRITRTIDAISAGNLTVRAEDADRADEFGHLARSFNAMTDILAHELEREQVLLAAAAHELRAPMTRMDVVLALLRRQAEGLKTEVETLKAGNEEISRPHANEELCSISSEFQQKKLFAELNQNIARAELEASRMNDLVNQLLHYAQQEVQEPAFDSIDLCDIINNIAEDARVEMEGKNCPVRVRLPESCILFGNAEQLWSAVENVVRNAIRYTDEGKGVDITLNREKGAWLLSIRDYGPGVPENSLPFLFRPFYRVDASRSRENGGVGLGLSLAAQAMRKHGGFISAKNSEGGGLLISMKFLSA